MASTASGFSFDRTVEKDLEGYAKGSPAEVLGRFREIILAAPDVDGSRAGMMAASSVVRRARNSASALS